MKMHACKAGQLNEKLDFYRQFNREVAEDRLGFFKCFDLHKSEQPNFSINDVTGMWQEYFGSAARKNREDAQSLYIHVPFCTQKCNFCCYDSVPYRDGLVKTYFDYMQTEIDGFAPLAGDVRFDTVYFGGGTPNIFKAEELEKLLAMVFGNFKVSDNPEIKVECNPNFSNQEKLKIYRHYGFNRISFGVQSFDPEVLRRAMRPGQSDEIVYAAVRDAEAIGIEDVNMDIMFGLEGDTTEKFLLSMEKAFGSGVGNIIIYKLMPTPSYYEEFLLDRNMTPDTREKEIFERIYDLESVFKGLRELALKHDYRFNEHELDYSSVNMGIGFKRPDLAKDFDRKKKNYSFYVDYPMSCLGLGPFSMSHVFGQAYYKNMNTQMRIDSEQKLYTGNSVTLEAEIIHDMASQIENENRIDIKKLENKFRFDFKKHFRTALDDLVRIKALNINDGIISLANNSLKSTEFLLFFCSPEHLRLLNKQKKVFQQKPIYAKD